MYIQLILAFLPAVFAAECVDQWFDQKLDHYTTNVTTFRQRYCVNSEAVHKEDPIIFFYAGNEGNYRNYVKHTGLMWENARDFNAHVVFAEHRYYGESLPCEVDPKNARQCLGYLHIGQVLSDYVVLIDYFIRKFAIKRDAPVIVFGGSYGGMLATWLRMAYPKRVLGAIASSAPLLLFQSTYSPTEPPAYALDYWRRVTNTAANYRASDGSKCDVAVSNALKMFKKAADAGNAEEFYREFRMCGRSATPQAAHTFIVAAFDSLAMGNYPYPIAYIMGDDTHLPPAWPMAVACAGGWAPEGPTPRRAANVTGGGEITDAGIATIASALQLVYNTTKDPSVKCFDTSQPAEILYTYDWQTCTEMMPEEIGYYPTQGGNNDMFLKEPYSYDTTWLGHCRAEFYGAAIPNPSVIPRMFGLKEGAAAVCNVVYTNGALDPWTGGSVYPGGPVAPNATCGSISIMIPNGAHHVDLMFKNKMDTADITATRLETLAQMRRWLNTATSTASEKSGEEVIAMLGGAVRSVA